MRVFGYVRLSRLIREEQTSPARQRQIIADTAAARGWTLVDTVEDLDVSASKKRLDRPGLNALRRRIAEGEADGVLVWRLDRLVRSVVDVGILLDEGLQIVSATEPFDTTSPMGRAMVEVSQVFAALESKTTAARVTSARSWMRQVGRWSGGQVPYGYRTCPHPNGVGRALEPHPEEAAIVRRMADEVLAGATPHAVARGLNRDGIPTRRRVKKKDGTETPIAWAPGVVRRILTSGVVLGRVREGGDRKAGREPDVIRDEHGLPMTFWEPLLPVEDVERVRAILATTPAAFGRRDEHGQHARLLAGLLTCPTCGGSLAVRSYKDNRQPPTYVCAASSRGRFCERGVTVRADLVEEEVSRRFLAEVGHHRFVEQRASLREVAGLAAVEEAIRDTTDALRRPDADLPSLVERLTYLREERARLAAAPAQPSVELVPGASFAETWDDADTDGRRGLLLAAGASIELATAGETRRRWSPDRVRVSFETSDGPLEVA